jgi:hypothetical protein
MKAYIKYAAAAAAGAIAAGSIVYAQAPASPPRAVISIYRAAPGHQEALLQWLAQQERIAAASGQSAGQLYAHTDGDSWDYLLVAPTTTDAQDQAFEASAAKMGLPSGPKAGLELRKHIESHTDTYVIGPMTAAQLLDRLK